ncbi:MAG TPA: ATP-binding protein [Bacteroidales bacterium]|nr:ATP-binding protein [Bacteroidales bacterium]HPM91774.1 ATP-binding protein [Bacteroidales bacterium]
MAVLEREMLTALTDQIDEKEFAILTGPRQSGKTTLLNQLAERLKQREEEVYSITLEDQSILSRLNQHPENLFDFVIRSAEKRQFVLIDEVQYLDNPSNFLKLLYDKYQPKLKIIATGSSAFYIDRKFKDSLAGRKKLFELFTLDFDEFLTFRTGASDLNEELNRIRMYKNYISSRRKELNSFFIEYLTYGGYPAVVLAASPERKIEKLKELMNSYLKRDISESNIQEQDRFYRLIMILAQQTGSLVNVNELSKTLKLSVTAVENYLYILQKCFHIQLVRPYYSNIRKELIKMPKVYFHDSGLRNILLGQFNPVEQRIDKGMLIENYAYIRLRQLYGNDTIRYWRTADGHEIDFVINPASGNGSAIEIKFDEENFNPKKYHNFLVAYPDYRITCRAFHASGNTSSLMAL